MHSLHAPSILAPNLLKSTVVVDCGTMDRRPFLQAIPMGHGGLPVKAPIIRHVLQKNVLHLMGNLCSLVDLERPALFLKELIELFIALFG